MNSNCIYLARQCKSLLHHKYEFSEPGLLKITFRAQITLCVQLKHYFVQLLRGGPCRACKKIGPGLFGLLAYAVLAQL